MKKERERKTYKEKKEKSCVPPINLTVTHIQENKARNMKGVDIGEENMADSGQRRWLNGRQASKKKSKRKYRRRKIRKQENMIEENKMKGRLEKRNIKSKQRKKSYKEEREEELQT